MHNQEFLNEYFSKHWTPGGDRGFSNPEKIAKLINDDEWLLDVGCGHNPFKGLVKNVVGIDPAFTDADILTTIELYNPDRLFDVATCLGSINFGDEITISDQIEKVVKCLKPTSRIFWRLNPGNADHNNQYVHMVPFFPWTFEILKSFANKHGYNQVNCQTELNKRTFRLYTEWHRNT